MVQITKLVNELVFLAFGMMSRTGGRNRHIAAQCLSEMCSFTFNDDDDTCTDICALCSTFD